MNKAWKHSDSGSCSCNHVPTEMNDLSVRYKRSISSWLSGFNWRSPNSYGVTIADSIWSHGYACMQWTETASTHLGTPRASMISLFAPRLRTKREQDSPGNLCSRFEQTFQGLFLSHIGQNFIGTLFPGNLTGLLMLTYSLLQHNPSD